MTYKSGKLFLTLDKAVEVAVNQFDVDPVIARQEFMQKCYIPSSDYEKGFYDGMERLRDIIEESMNKGLYERATEALSERTGEWLEVEVLPEVYDIEGVKTWGSEMQCDQCGFRHTAIEGHMAQYNFCPNCGADMRENGERKEEGR